MLKKFPDPRWNDVNVGRKITLLLSSVLTLPELEFVEGIKYR